MITLEPRGFRARLEAMAPPPDTEWEALRAQLTRAELARGDMLVRVGDAELKVAYVESGVLRAYYMTPDGGEASRNFALPGGVIGPLASALTKAPSNVAIEAVEDTVAYWITYEKMAAFFPRHPSWEIIGRKTTEYFYLIRERHSYQLLMMTAEERYEAFLADFPQLFERIPLKHVASYLGIAPESLSRLRRKRR